MKISKTVRWAVAAMAICATFSLTACSDEVITSEEVSTTLEKGSWHVSLFKKDGADMSSSFLDHHFHFNTNGTAVCYSPGDTTTGTWSSSDGDSVGVTFNFGFGFPFLDLTSAWKVTEHSETGVSMLDDDTGGAGINELRLSQE
jgi:hypothetical protein